MDFEKEPIKPSVFWFLKHKTLLKVCAGIIGAMVLISIPFFIVLDQKANETMGWLKDRPEIAKLCKTPENRILQNEFSRWSMSAHYHIYSMICGSERHRILVDARSRSKNLQAIFIDGEIDFSKYPLD